MIITRNSADLSPNYIHTNISLKTLQPFIKYEIYHGCYIVHYCTFQNYDHRRNTNLNYKKIRTHTVYNHIIIIIYHGFEIQFLISFSLLMAADLKLYETNST